MALRCLTSTTEPLDDITNLQPLQIDENDAPSLLIPASERPCRQPYSSLFTRKPLLNSCPLHPPPFHDELLSSWLVRLAQANCTKLFTFCSKLLPYGRDTWSRDIDRSAKPLFLESLATLTSQPIADVKRTVLLDYENRIFLPSSINTGSVYFLPVGIFHRTRKRFGQQFCRQCLIEDRTPYFRKSWRLSLVTICPKHKVHLEDSCHFCGAPVVFFRQEIGNRYEAFPISICTCSNCKGDIRHGSVRGLIDSAFNTRYEQLVLSFDELIRFNPSFACELPIFCLTVLRLAHLFIKPNKKKLLEVQDMIWHEVFQIAPIRQSTRLFGYTRTNIRYHAICLALWILDEWPDRFLEYMTRAHVTSSDILTEFDDAPIPFARIVMSNLFHPLPCSRKKGWNR